MPGIHHTAIVTADVERSMRFWCDGPGVTRTPMLAKPELLPGWVEGLTERTALGRLGEADDVAEAIVAVLEMSWVTGQIVFADGGLALHSPIDAYGQIQRAMRRGG
jgi:NAD(P)-dependent dehydrogenase (short-subunit alcohol dehydrogenase family)